MPHAVADVMTRAGLGEDAPVEALAHALASGATKVGAADRALFLRARSSLTMKAHAGADWLHEQTFKPDADALKHIGLRTGSPAADERYPLVLVLPPRQRDEARALLARALTHLDDDGVVIASMANAEGARSAEADLNRLCAEVHSLSKHKCRVFWSRPTRDDIDAALRNDWLALDAIRPIADGSFVSRPGLFAWDRIDAASALLASRLPDTLAGRVADLGAGYGYLAAHVLRQCAGVTAIDLYEAEARALEPAQLNLDRCARGIPVTVHWHDVTAGLPHRYDAIVSNPPFHLGRADQPAIGRAFIRSAAAALNADGQFWLVANRHLPYESTLATQFAQVRSVADAGGFKVIHASQPRA